MYATDTPERWLVVSVATDEQWSALVDALGRPDWATDPALAHPRRPPRPHDLLDEKLGAWAADTDLDKAVDLLARGGRPGGAGGRRPHYVGAPAVRRPWLLRVRSDHPVIGVPRRTRRCRSASPASTTGSATPAPTLGQHNHEILTDLGLSDDEIAALEADRPSSAPARSVCEHMSPTSTH